MTVLLRRHCTHVGCSNAWRDVFRRLRKTGSEGAEVTRGGTALLISGPTIGMARNYRTNIPYLKLQHDMLSPVPTQLHSGQCLVSRHASSEHFQNIRN